jgi:DNA-binding MarR family transcriptional regulator
VNNFEVNPATMEAVEDVVVAALKVRRAVARRAGLSDLELQALEHLMGTPRSSPTELAHLLEVSTAASTGVVDRLEGRGHVQRSPHPSDRRRTELQVTPSGRQEMVELLRPMLAELLRLDAELDPAERVTIEKYLRGVIVAFAKVSDPER